MFPPILWELSGLKYIMVYCEFLRESEKPFSLKDFCSHGRTIVGVLVIAIAHFALFLSLFCMQWSNAPQTQPWEASPVSSALPGRCEWRL